MNKDRCHILLGSILVLLIFPLPAVGGLPDTSRGKQLFTGHCAKCHGRSGEGFRKLYPPLQNSRFLQVDAEQLPCIIRYGMKGETTVDGVVFNQTMPGNPRLTPEEIGLITGYMQQAWKKPITVLPVEELLENCRQKP